MTGCLAIVQPVAQGTVLHLIMKNQPKITNTNKESRKWKKI